MITQELATIIYLADLLKNTEEDINRINLLEEIKDNAIKIQEELGDNYEIYRLEENDYE